MLVTRKVWTHLLLILLLLFTSIATSTAIVSAQADPDAERIFIPLISGAESPGAQSQPIELVMQKVRQSNVYLVVMATDPVVAYEGSIAGYAATRPAAGQKIDRNSEQIQRYVAFLQARHNAALARVGASVEDKIHSYTYALNGFAARLTPEEASALASEPEVAFVKRDELRTFATDNSPFFLGLPETGGPWAKRIRGDGVVVGVIDSGIWPEHPSFADDGSYDPPPTGALPCEFGNSAHNPNDAPFRCNNKLIGARQMLATYKAVIGLGPGEFDSARDDNGHGTHTTSTAAGNAGAVANIFGINRGAISGIAPRAHIIAYKGLGEFGGFESDLTAAIDTAVADGVDVINFSVGGGPTLTSTDALAFLFAADAGVFVATSAGNAGPGPETIGGPASVPWLTAVGASTQDRSFISDIMLDGPGDEPQGLWGGSITPGVSNYDLVDAEGIADSVGDTSGQCLNPFPPGTFDQNDAVLCNDYTPGVARTTRVANVAAGGGGAVLLHNVPLINVTPTDNHPLPTVHLLYEVGEPLKSYLVAHPGEVKISFTQGIARKAPADARVQPNVMASFSSRGPNPVALDIIKPDVTAPGVQILAGNTPSHYLTATQGELYQVIQGTSMSSPHVAGIFALIKQAYPHWTPAMAKSALMTTAYQAVFKEDGVTRADPFDIGAGHVDPGGRASRGSLFLPGLVYDAGLLEYFGFLCSAAPEIFLDPATTCNGLEAIGIPTDPSNLNLPSIGIAELAGTQTITRQVTSVAPERGWQTYTVSTSAPAGYIVSVDPISLTIASGETLTYTVTITNDGSAPIGEWRFGSLTWMDIRGFYSAYSPIAVRGALFNAPATVSGSGESGSLSFDVQFGYTGDYEAGAHGLVAATLTTDSVPQDPDQNFDPGDGFSNAHTFDLTGALHFRAAIPPEATEPNADLDLYLFDPDGNLAAISGAGGTNEQIDIAQPAAGTWTLYVHGWSTPGGDSPYDLHSWVIPSTSGGNLQIEGAPPAAEVGETGTISISWHGATVGEWHLGAVSHNRDSDLLGATLVEVDNR